MLRPNNAIPSGWREKLCDRTVIEQLAAGLYTLSQEIPKSSLDRPGPELRDVGTHQ